MAFYAILRAGKDVTLQEFANSEAAVAKAKELNVKLVCGTSDKATADKALANQRKIFGGAK